MTIRTNKRLRVSIQKGTATGTALTPTGITKAEPAVVTVADTTGMTKGDLVRMAGTDFVDLDGKMFVAGDIAATTFPLLGSDTSDETAALGASPTATYFDSADLQAICLSEVAPSNPEAGTISIGTYCNPGATLPGNPTAGSITFSGFVDEDDAGFLELLDAESEGDERAMRISHPSDAWFFAGAVTVGSLGYTFPLEGAATYTANGALSLPLRFIAA